MTDSALALGIVQNDGQQTFDTFVQQTLKEAGITASIHCFQTKEDVFKAVAEGLVAAFACPLHSAPTILPMGLVITALTERKAANNCLISQNSAGDVFSQKKEAKVLTLSDINRAQMQYLQPDYTVEKTSMSPKESLEAVRSGAFDAVVLSQFDAHALCLQTEEWSIQPFSVREFIPSAGQGAVCFIASEEDLPTRRLLKDVHHAAVSAATNIERTVQKTLEDHEVSAYCERDRMGNYHLWAAVLIDDELRRMRLSQSTSFGMAEKIVEQLLSA